MHNKSTRLAENTVSHASISFFPIFILITFLKLNIETYNSTHICTYVPIYICCDARVRGTLCLRSCASNGSEIRFEQQQQQHPRFSMLLHPRSVHLRNLIFALMPCIIHQCIHIFMRRDPTTDTKDANRSTQQNGRLASQ